MNSIFSPSQMSLPSDYVERYLNEISRSNYAFTLKWPNYCRTCAGWGFHQWFERHDSYGPGEPMSEPCPDCAGTCARCRTPIDEPYEVCPSCGWAYDDGLHPY